MEHQNDQQLTEPDIMAAEKSNGSGANSKRTGILAVLIGGAGLVFKLFKPLLIGLKALKMGVVLKSGVTMVLALWVYALAWGWQFAAAFIILLFLHELGHVWALREYGIRAGAPLFIPFVGAFIGMKEMPKNAETEAWVGISGPLLGTGAATLCWAGGLYTGNPFWYAVAYTGFFLNLFNLIPVRPLDGGRTVAAISPKLWIVGFLVILVWLFRSFNPILVLILFLAGRNLFELFKNRNAEHQESYYQVSSRGKMQLSLCYFGLLAYLAVAMSLTQVQV